MILSILSNFLIIKEEWDIVDLRIDIPDLGPGSDAINRHTQYSNPVATVTKSKKEGIGAGFTLGLGNNLICSAIEDILELWDGLTLNDIANKNFTNVYNILANPHQIRWLSPNAGVNYQAVGVIVNTIIDWICKDQNMPAWQMFTKVTKSEFNEFYSSPINLSHVMKSKDYIFNQINGDYNTRELSISAYHTTWIGSSADELSEEIIAVNQEKGINLFKLKIGKNPDLFVNKINELKHLLPDSIKLCTDANQTMDLSSAKKFISMADELGIIWLEEPFAPDNIDAFKKLLEYRDSKNLQIEIVSGENCPSPHIAAALMELGIHRFQADPCRMMGFIDIVLISQLGRFFNVPITPHAGGSCLDELSLHISFYDQIQNNFNIEDALIENVGFCSQFMRYPSIVKNGKIQPPIEPGFLVGFNKDIISKFKNYKEGITWLKL
jgi:L-alanine-DL-glutamate epimerase-like enolase superfamily enzyme